MSSIPQSYQISVTHQNRDRVKDSNRIVDIGADAIRAARRALNHLPQDQSMMEFFNDSDPLAAFCHSLNQRKVLDQGFSQIVEELLAVTVSVPEHDALAEKLMNFKLAMRDAQDLSDRYLDLISAENVKANAQRSTDPSST